MRPKGTQSAVVNLLLAVTLAACGNTRRTPAPTDSVGDGGATSPVASGGGGNGGSTTASAGSLSGGGGSVTTNGGEPPDSVGGAPVSTDCVDGAYCTCEDLPGVMQCADAEGSPSGRCSCPPAGECQATRGSCFEPCGGDATGLWVLEQTCFHGAAPADCAGATIAGTSPSAQMVLRVVEDEPVTVHAKVTLDLVARVPLSCLGIESVDRCVDAEYYASPSFFGVALPLRCDASECGECQCGGSIETYGGGGSVWRPGSGTVPFGAIEVPFCVDGETMWVGGGNVGGEPKAAFKLRRRSCLGTPKACEERGAEECDASGDCIAGRCVPVGADDNGCEGWSEDSCEATLGCTWVPGCWGDASERCPYAYCEATPGCGWGDPVERCGGEPKSCYGLAPDACEMPGCSVRTCDVPDGWSGIDQPPCDRLTASACSKAAGCTLSGGACVGTTTCAAQTDPAVCAMLECAVYDAPRCGGYPTRPCAELSVEDCRSQPGCHPEW